MQPARYKYFVAVPMSSIPKEEYEEFKGFLVQLCTLLGGGDRRNIFCAALDAESANFDHPAAALIIDDDAMNKSDAFVLIAAKSLPKSSIWCELGWPLVQRKPITIFYKDPDDLPLGERPSGTYSYADYVATDDEALPFDLVKYITPADILAHYRAG